MIFIFWIFFVLLVAIWADSKGVSVIAATLIAAIFSPLLGAIYVLLSGGKK